MNKLKNLEIKKLILEMELIEIDENYSKEFIENYRPKFNEHLRNLSPEFFEKTNTPKEEAKSPTDLEADLYDTLDVSEDELKKIKKVYKEISKICHPDKTKDQDLNELYVEANLAYEKNDLMKLIKISNRLSLDFQVDEGDVSTLKREIEKRKSNLIKVEGTFLWLWVNAKTDEAKENIIKMYVQQHS